jgi:hypothetical protein
MNCIDDMLLFYSPKWDEAAWHIMLHTVLRHLFCMPEGPAGSPVAAAAAAAVAAAAAAAAADGGAHPQEAHAPSSVSAEGLLARIDQYFPQMCQQLSSIQPRFRRELLRELTSISLHYIQAGREQLAVAGLQGWVRLIHALAPQADADDWSVALEGLAAVAKRELGAASSAMAALHTQHAGAAGAVPAQLRARCRLLVLMQRALEQVHQDAGAMMPWPVQLRMLALLTESVEVAMRANSSSAAPAAPAGLQAPSLAVLAIGSGGGPEAAAAGEAGSATQLYVQQWMAGELSGPDSTSSSAVGSRRSTLADAEVQQQQQQQKAEANGSGSGPAANGDAPMGESLAGQAAGSAEAAERPGAAQEAIGSGDSSLPGMPPGGAMPALVGSSVHSRERAAPLMMRLEAEGGLLLLAALQRSLGSLQEQQQRQAQLGDALDWVQQELEERQRSVTLMIISAAVQVGAGGGGGPGSGNSSNWEDAVRAPLVVEALRALLGQGRGLEQLRRDVAAVFPQLAALMCSSQPLVRQVLFEVIRAAQLDKLALMGAGAGLAFTLDA